MIQVIELTSGVITLLQSCLGVSMELKRLRNEAVEIRTTVTAISADVQAMRQVLQSMEETLDHLEPNITATEDMRSHWSHLSRSLNDGNGAVLNFYEVLKNVNRYLNTVDKTGRQGELKTTASKIVYLRQQVQAYKETFELSNQTIVL